MIGTGYVGPETVDFLAQLVDADHVDTELGETSGGDEADIAGADHGDMHGEIPLDFI